MKKTIYSIILVALLGLRGAAQDFQFTQYFATPLLLNPALTGYIPDAEKGERGGGISPDGRLALAYRSQYYRNVPDYDGATAMVDWRRCIACVNCGKSRSFWAIGLLLQGDRSPFAHFSQARAGVSGAFHLGLGRNASMSVGGSAAFFNFGFDPSGLRFDEQFDGIGFNANVGRAEPLLGTDKRRSQLDLNAGLNVTFPVRGGQLTAGLAFYHLKPVAYTLSTSGNQLGLGTGFYVTHEIQGWTSRVFWRRQSMFGQQSRQHQVLLGTMRNFKGPFALGMMTRINNHWRQPLRFEGLIPMFQLRSGPWIFLASYDVPLSSVRRVAAGALELSAQYVFGQFGRCVYCPGM